MSDFIIGDDDAFNAASLSFSVFMDDVTGLVVVVPRKLLGDVVPSDKIASIATKGSTSADAAGCDVATPLPSSKISFSIDRLV